MIVSTQQTNQSTFDRLFRFAHSNLVLSRRVKCLVDALVTLIPEGSKVLDVGTGGGAIAAMLMERRSDLSIVGVDVLVRPETLIPVREFNGVDIPFPNSSFDCAMLIDVLHHTDCPEALLAEVARVAGKIVIKDHYRNGPFAEIKLRFMDWVGNASHGVRLPYNYLSRDEWRTMWQRLNFTIERLETDLLLYPKPLSFLFGDGLHFIARLATC
ncbi:MAG: class I SAM-dependent methyltransferase [Sphingomicrobium sp.]